MDLPKTFDEFVDARKQGFIRAKEFKDNGGKLAGCLCSYTPQELLDAAGVATVGLAEPAVRPYRMRKSPSKEFMSADQEYLWFCIF